MAAMLMLVRVELRNRWKSVVALALLVGVRGCVRARVDRGRAPHRFVAGALRAIDGRGRRRDQRGRDDRRTVRARSSEHPTSKRSPRSGNSRSTGRTPASCPSPGPLDDEFGRTVDRARLVEGRKARALDELTIGEGLTSKLGVRVGDRLTFDSFSPEQIASNDGPFTPEGPRFTFRIVGLVRRPLDLGGRGAAGGVIVPTRRVRRRVPRADRQLLGNRAPRSHHARCR